MNQFTATAIPGVVVIEPQMFRDARGWFSRGFHQLDFLEAGILFSVAQNNVSWNMRQGTVRGLHFQYPPAAESKLVRCTNGAIFDVVVDLRPESATFLQSFHVELSGLRMVHIPERCAHGYQTLTEGAEVSYMVSAMHAPELEGGLRHDDPALDIRWPLPVAAISEKDRCWPSLERAGDMIAERMSA